ncbi:MAG: DUF1302 family protein [Sulfurovum sp.]|nr:DUF1302 family protein [Sulfurovum sp.]
MRLSLLVSSLLLTVALQAENIDDTLSGFDDDMPTQTESVSANDIQDGFDEGDESVPHLMKSEEDEESYFTDFSGKITQEGAIAYNDDRPQNVFGSLRQSLFLYYEHKFENNIKVKINARAFYDPMYDTSTSADFYPAEVAELNSEVELFEAYVEGTIIENLDARLGRQVIVWGKSDTIRITDVLNPIDNRRPGYQDLESLYLPKTMLKFDYQYDDNWRITPIVTLEQRFTKDPPYGSVYNPLSPDESYSDRLASGEPIYSFDQESYNDPTFALSVAGEFEGWDITFYAARLYQDRGYIPVEALDRNVLHYTIEHTKTNMLGAAFNIVENEWLFKAELAYFSDLTYTSTQDKSLARTDMLLGFEYNGFSDTTLSYDYSIRHFMEDDLRLNVPFENILAQNTYQQAFRISSSFLREKLNANYLISLYGKKLDEGGYQRAWIDYDVADAINTQFGLIDYFGGSELFDLVEDQVVVFMDVSYSF